MPSDITQQPITRSLHSKRAVVFTRARFLPLDTAGELAQLAAQEAYCRQVARALGAQVVTVYSAHSGTTSSGVGRTIDRLLEEVGAGHIDFVITSSHDRLARRPVDLARIAHHIAASGARLVTTADPRENFLQDISLYCLIAKSQERARR